MIKLEKMTGLTTTALVLLIVGAIDSIRNLPATALFGSSLIFFFLFSAVIFLVPAALVSAELSSLDTEKGGIYHWTHSTTALGLVGLVHYLHQSKRRTSISEICKRLFSHRDGTTYGIDYILSNTVGYSWQSCTNSFYIGKSFSISCTLI